jgi:hypothetical protein
MPRVLIAPSVLAADMGEYGTSESVTKEIGGVEG